MKLPDNFATLMSGLLITFFFFFFFFFFVLLHMNTVFCVFLLRVNNGETVGRGGGIHWAVLDDICRQPQRETIMMLRQ